MKIFNFYKPKLSDVSYSADGWTLHDNTKNNKSWYTEKRDATRIQFFDGPIDWPFDLTSEGKAREFFENESRKIGGALIEIEVKRIAQIESLVGIFKYKSQVENHLGKYYIGIIWMPFEKFTFQVNFESLEQGTTGTREAAVSIIENPEGIESNDEPESVSSMKELLQKLGQHQIEAVPSDERKYDKDFPDHPLTKVRKYLEFFENNVAINKELLKQKPYRYKNA